MLLGFPRAARWRLLGRVSAVFDMLARIWRDHHALAPWFMNFYSSIFSAVDITPNALISSHSSFSFDPLSTPP